MNGPSNTPPVLIVLTLPTESSWNPGSASLPELPHFSYQAPISCIHASRSGPGSCWPDSVISPRIRYFIARLRLPVTGTWWHPHIYSTNGATPDVTPRPDVSDQRRMGRRAGRLLSAA